MTSDVQDSETHVQHSVMGAIGAVGGLALWVLFELLRDSIDSQRLLLWLASATLGFFILLFALRGSLRWRDAALGAAVLALAGAYQPRRPVVEGCEYREGLEAVSVSGGVAGNVVPDEATLILNHRFAPDRSLAAATQHIHEVLDEVLEDGDSVEVVDAAPGAAPGLSDPLLVELVRRSGAPARAKLGWTDAAFFSARGVPASNFGPGDPLLAHAAAERVDRSDLNAVYDSLKALLTTIV